MPSLVNWNFSPTARPVAVTVVVPVGIIDSAWKRAHVNVQYIATLLALIYDLETNTWFCSSNVWETLLLSTSITINAKGEQSKDRILGQKCSMCLHNNRMHPTISETDQNDAVCSTNHSSAKVVNISF